MNFTFGLLLYNQEDFLLETLESIKYQIDNYGQNIACDLIINDDASSDDSVKIASKWVEINKHLFRNVIFNVNKANMGTVASQQFIMNKNTNPFCKIVACDDVFGSVNLFQKYATLKRDQIKTFVRIELRNGMLSVDESRLKLFYVNQNLNGINDKLSAMRRGCYLHTPSTIYSADMFHKSNCRSKLRHFKYFEDDPMWYFMIKNINDIDINFNEDLIMLYRVSEKSVSNGSNVANIFYPELKKLWKIYFKDSKGMEKVYFWFKLHDTLPKIFRLDKYIDRLRNIRMNYIVKNNYNYIQLLNKMKKSIEKEQEYYNEISEKALNFKKLVIEE